MTGDPTNARQLAQMDYAPLSAKLEKEMVTTYRTRCEVPGYDESTGYDEQRSPTLRHKPDSSLWQRRYRLNAFAQANGLDYVFRSNPKHWPGMRTEISARWGGKITDVSALHDVLQGTSTTEQQNDGLRYMACGMELVRAQGAVTGRDIRHDDYTVLALHHGATTKQVYLKHRWRKDAAASELLEANYSLDDPFTNMWRPKDAHQQYGFARPILTQDVLALALQVAPGYDLFLSGGWLYLMKPYSGFTDIDKKHATEELLRERFEAAAQLAPALGASAMAHADAKAQGVACPDVPETEKQRKRRETQEADAVNIDRKARTFVEKLKEQHPEGGPTQS